MQLDKMQSKLLEVRKAGNKVGRAVMQSLIADFDKQARTGKEVDGMALIRKYLDNAKTNMQLEVQRKNSAGAKAYGLEAAFLESLLPKQLSENDLYEIITSGRFGNVGEVMKYMKSNYAGKYDPKLASAIAKDVL